MGNKPDQTVMEITNSLANSQKFDKVEGKFIRTINFEGQCLEGETSSKSVGNIRPEIGWYIGRLRGNETHWNTENKGKLRILDMFSGAGGLALGAAEAARAA